MPRAVHLLSASECSLSKGDQKLYEIKRTVLTTCVVDGSHTKFHLNVIHMCEMLQNVFGVI